MAPCLRSAFATAAAELADATTSLEAKSGGRLGVAIIDVTTRRGLSHRADERFPILSTFKFVLSACVLERVERGEERLDRLVRYARTDLVEHSPVTEKHVEEGMTVGALCHATMTWSDNAAANLLLASFGGPAALTAFMRRHGDLISRLDRIETALNEAAPGDPRDTTTPAAMLGLMQRILLGDVLSATSRERIVAWLVGNRTGDARIRAGLPSEWRAGDRTGTGGHASANDVAIVWPAPRRPLLIASYLTGSTLTPDGRNGVHAEVGRIAARLAG